MSTAHPCHPVGPTDSSQMMAAATPRRAQRALRIVALGGGTGLPAVVEGLCAAAAEAGETGKDLVTAVATVTDDGGSSGRLRRELGVLPPGDIRNCLAALAHLDSPFRELLQHRFNGSSSLDGHPVGNLLLAALTQITDDFPEAVQRLGDLIGLRGRVLPTTGQDVRLRAEMESGEIWVGETAIVARKARIQRLSLDPSPRPLPDVLQALVNADGIVVGPGSLYTSVIPNLLVEGLASTIYGANAVRIYVANLMTEPGETDDYTLDDHLRAIRVHAGHDLFDYILVNRRPLDSKTAARYAAEGSRPVNYGAPHRWAGLAQVVEWDLSPDCAGQKIRHDPTALAAALRAIIRRGRPRGYPIGVSSYAHG